jgi:signal transduction histidine kinase
VTDSTDLPGWNFEVGFVRHVIGHEFVVQSNAMTYFYNDETKKLRKLGGATFLNNVAIFGSMVYMASDQLSYFYDLIHPESKSDKLVPKNLIHKYCWNCLESILDVSVMPGKNKIVFATDSNVFEYTPGYQRPLKFNDQNIVASALLHDNGKLYIASVKLGLLIYQSEKVRRVISKEELGPEKILGFRKIGDKIWLLNSGVPKIFDPAKERLDRNAMTDDYSVTDVLQFGKMVYFLSSNGLYTVNINSDPDTTSFNCKNTFTLINGRDTVYDDQIKASHDKNDFQFNLSSAVFRSAADTRYKYRLNSATQGEWNITSGQSGLIRFASLKPGEYVFEAMAINPARGTSQNIVHASFIILPPWWDTWIFKSITLLILLALIFLSVRIYYRIQINRQRVYFENKLNIEKEQQRISREIHDDIGQSLSVIKMNLAIGDPEQLREARTIISDVIKDLRNLTHTLYYGSTLQNDLITSIKMSIKRLNAAKQLKADLCISGKQNFLSDELELAIYRVFQEAVNNTLKHADALTIRVTISFQEKDFVMIIEDDGKGFDISSAAEGIGMASIRKRAETIGGIIEVSSLPGSGTKITLKIHL